jgi:hypothetical protein
MEGEKGDGGGAVPTRKRGEATETLHVRASGLFLFTATVWM